MRKFSFHAAAVALTLAFPGAVSAQEALQDGEIPGDGAAAVATQEEDDDDFPWGLLGLLGLAGLLGRKRDSRGDNLRRN